MCAKLFGPVDERVLASAAAAVELIHNASLIHDDVVDLNAMTRRSRGPTVNVVWDNHIAACRRLTSILVGHAGSYIHRRHPHRRRPAFLASLAKEIDQPSNAQTQLVRGESTTS